MESLIFHCAAALPKLHDFSIIYLKTLVIPSHFRLNGQLIFAALATFKILDSKTTILLLR